MKAGTIFFLTDQVRLEGRMWYSSNGTNFQSAGIRDCFSLQVTSSAVFTTQLHVSKVCRPWFVVNTLVLNEV